MQVRGRERAPTCPFSSTELSVAATIDGHVTSRIEKEQGRLNADSTSPGLIRAVSRWQLVGLSINDVIGSGVYLLPAAAAALLGTGSIFGVILAGLAVALLVLCFAEASGHFDEPGGAYLYAREAFGEFVGFEVGWMTWLARVASVASLSNGFALAAGFLWPAASEGIVRAGLITALIVALASINVVGVRQGATTAVVLVLAKSIPLLIFVVGGIFFVDWGRLGAMQWPASGALGEASLLLLFAYAGFENAPAAAGEYRDPRRDMPFALLTMIVSVTLLYTGVQVVALGTLPDLAISESPVAEAAGRFLGAGGALLMTIGALVSIGGNIGNTVLTGPRYLFAMAQDGYGPRFLASVHPRFHTPAASILTLCALSLVLALTGSFVQLAMLSVVARLTTYICTAAAVPVLRRRRTVRPGAVRLPGGPTIPLLALGLSLAFVLSARAEDLIAGAIALTAGSVLYLTRRRDPR
jgi:amino acid transporter